MKFISVFFCLFFILAFKKAGAQYYFYNDSYYDNAVLFEGGVSIGAMNSLTDIGGKKGSAKNF